MRLSASQVQTFSDCQRKWSWRYVAGVEETSSPAAELGKAVHAQLEKYLRGGEIDFTGEVGYIAAAGLEYLPKPGTPGLQVEEEFHFEGPSGHSYLGYKDLQVPGVVFDHKTTSDLKWQKTTEDLKNDIQATLYAVDYFRNHPDELEVELRWVYYQTKNAKKSAITILRVGQTETWQRFLEIEKITETMSAAADKQPLELPPNVNHCSAYGGCPHQGRCNLSPFDKMRAHMEQNRLTLLLQAKKNGAATAPATQAPPAAPVAPAAAAAASPPTANRLLARLQAGGAPSAAVNPPEYQPPPDPQAMTPAAVAQVPAPQVAQAPAPQAAQAALVAQAAQAAQAPAAPAQAAGRGRPKKAVVPATGLAVKIDTLYLDCGPVGVAVADATNLIALAKKRVAAEGLADYRFAEFGHGPGMLAVAAAAELDALEGVLPALRLDTTTPEGSIVAVEFAARASLVVR
jgi:CRISPR/Cas system-associated exonuclease Cas4 (RecB family)